MGNGTLHVGPCCQLYTILDNKLEKWCSFFEAEAYYNIGVKYGDDDYKCRCANICRQIKNKCVETLNKGCSVVSNNVCTDVPMTHDAIQNCIKRFCSGKRSNTEVSKIPKNAHIGSVSMDERGLFRSCGIHMLSKNGLRVLKWVLTYDTTANLFYLQNHDMIGSWYVIGFRLLYDTYKDCYNVEIKTVDITTIARFDGAASISGTKHFEAHRYTQKYLPICQSLIDRMQKDNTLSKIVQG